MAPADQGAGLVEVGAAYVLRKKKLARVCVGGGGSKTKMLERKPIEIIMYQLKKRYALVGGRYCCR